MFVVHTSNCHGQNCTRRAIFRLGIDTLIANILVMSSFAGGLKTVLVCCFFSSVFSHSCTYGCQFQSIEGKYISSKIKIKNVSSGIWVPCHALSHSRMVDEVCDEDFKWTWCKCEAPDGSYMAWRRNRTFNTEFKVILQRSLRYRAYDKQMQNWSLRGVAAWGPQNWNGVAAISAASESDAAQCVVWRPTCAYCRNCKRRALLHSQPVTTQVEFSRQNVNSAPLRAQTAAECYSRPWADVVVICPDKTAA